MAKVKIWTGFGPHPELNIENNKYHWLLFHVHNFIVKLIRKAAVGSEWTDTNTLQPDRYKNLRYVWTEKGWWHVR